MILEKAINNGKHFILFHFRSSRSKMVCKKMFLKISQNSLENGCARVFFLVNLQAWGLQLCFIKKKDSDTGVLLWILQNI